jgi:hypothetical protein
MVLIVGYADTKVDAEVEDDVEQIDDISHGLTNLLHERVNRFANDVLHDPHSQGGITVSTQLGQPDFAIRASRADQPTNPGIGSYTGHRPKRQHDQVV